MGPWPCAIDTNFLQFLYFSRISFNLHKLTIVEEQANTLRTWKIYVQNNISVKINFCKIVSLWALDFLNHVLSALNINCARKKALKVQGHPHSFILLQFYGVQRFLGQ